MKHTWTHEDKEFMGDQVLSRVTLETEAEVLGEVLEAFEMYLRGCGYVFEGSITIVEDDL